MTVEQLFKSREGHLPRLYLLLRHHHFQRHITRINVDEVHNIYTAGLSLYGLDAFRPAWGRLDELKAILPKDTRWSGFSATIPPHILKVVEKKSCARVTNTFTPRQTVQCSFERIDIVSRVHIGCWGTERGGLEQSPNFCANTLRQI